MCVYVVLCLVWVCVSVSLCFCVCVMCWLCCVCNVLVVLRWSCDVVWIELTDMASQIQDVDRVFVLESGRLAHQVRVLCLVWCQRVV